MYIYTKEDLKEYPQFHDAILLCELSGLKWVSLYMDPSGELAITFDRLLTEERIKFVLMHFLDIIYNECNIDAINPKENVDYVYNYYKKQTQIFTPDGLDYRNHIPSYNIIQMR